MHDQENKKMVHSFNTLQLQEQNWAEDNTNQTYWKEVSEKKSC